jgi:outer membrane protein insertion porin family
MFKRVAIRLVGFALIPLLPAIVSAQTPPPQQISLQSVAFKGTHLFSDQQLLSAIGLKIGSTYTQQDLVDAANKLASSGVFDKVTYRFSSAWAEFDLVDNPHLLPLHFDNCVWMSDEQMIAELKKRVPLFTGEVPADGRLADEMGPQVEAALADKGVKAKVQALPFADNGVVKAYSYNIIDPRIEVSAIHFTGASATTAKSLDEASKGLLGKEYTTALLPSSEETLLQPVFRENGYLRGRFGLPSVKLASAPADPIAKVELILPVEEGAQYRIASLSVKGDDPVALDAAKRLAQFKTGDVANMVAFRKELSKLGGAYLASGHMNAKVKADPTLDETAHTVSYDIELVPGEVYKLSKLELQGLDDAKKAKLLPLWKLNPGDVFDPTYAPNFLERNRSKLGFLNGWSLAWTQKLYDDSHTVELFVFFRGPGSGAR